MSRNAKIVLGVIGGLVVLCVIVVVVVVIVIQTMGPSIIGNMVIDDPAEAAEAAGKIADYDLPAGYHEQMVMNIIVGKMIFIAADDMSGGTTTKPIIMLMQISSAAVSGGQMDEEQFRQQMQQSMEQQASKNNVSLQYVGDEEVEIDGKTVTLMTYEGQDDTGSTMRQVTSTLFEVNDNYLMLMIMGSADEWPEDDIDAFITSIN